MRTITPKQLKAILAKHLKWVLGEEGGKRANLSRANLSGANLSRAKSSSICRMDFGGWSICIREDKTSIGCQNRDNADWLKWTPASKEIKEMELNASAWWAIHGPVVKAAIRVVMKKAKGGK